jgi:peroxiredoxin
MTHISYMRASVAALAAIALCSCKDAPTSPKAPTETPMASAPVVEAPKAAVAAPVAGAEVGKPAPDFELRDLDGKAVKLSAYRGKVVVLEWFNAGCPFVKAAHGKGSLKTAAKDAMGKGVVWLAINSSAEGKQGAGVDANREGAKKFGLSHPVLLDTTGTVGHMYGATNTPHLFVIDEAGTLVYRGAVDNSPDGEGESPTGGKLVSYVDATLSDLAAKRPVAVPSTKAYGCGVKY